MHKAENLVLRIGKYNSKFSSIKLKMLTTLKEEGGILPQVSKIVNNFDKFIA
jgi:hypothetical protein